MNLQLIISHSEAVNKLVELLITDYSKIFQGHILEPAVTGEDFSDLTAQQVREFYEKSSKLEDDRTVAIRNLQTSCIFIFSCVDQ